MTQSTILTSGSSQTTSSDVTVAAGSTVTVGIFPASGGLAQGAEAIVYLDTPGGDLPLQNLGNALPACQIVGPCTFRVRRIATGGVDFGIFLET